MPLNVSPLKSVSSAKNHKDGIVKEPYTTVRFLYNPSVMRTGRHYFCASTLSVFLAGSKGQESYSIGEYLFTPESATLLHKPTGEATLIPRREADILQLLCKGSGSIIPTQNILLSLWGDDDFFNARSLQVLITRLRHRFSKDPRIQILNVRGVGYKLFAE